jgi:hypothetical protein
MVSPADRLDRVRELAAAGVPAQQIAHAVGISCRHLYDYARVHGIDVTTRHRRPNLTDRVVALVAEGLPVAEIAERLDMRPWRVREYARRRGVVPHESSEERIEITWFSSDSARLDAQILAERRPRPSRTTDPDLTRACRAIMAYPLVSGAGFLDVNLSTPDGAWRA